jgi:hypothetical protein
MQLIKLENGLLATVSNILNIKKKISPTTTINQGSKHVLSNKKGLNSSQPSKLKNNNNTYFKNITNFKMTLSS